MEKYRNAAIQAAISLDMNPYRILEHEELEQCPDRVISMLTGLHSLMAESRELLLEVLKVDPDLFEHLKKDIF